MATAGDFGKGTGEEGRDGKGRQGKDRGIDPQLAKFWSASVY